MNRVKISLFGAVVAILATSASYGQSDTTYWKRGAKGTLTFTQTSLTNWAAGGNNAVSLNWYLNAFANYAKDRTTWENNLELGYGLVDQGGLGFRKSDDRIIFTTKYGYKLKEKLYWSTLLDFKSQFVEGINYAEDGTETKISDWLAPGYITVATGLEWKPSDKFSLLYAPITGKITLVGSEFLSQQGAFGVEPGDNSLSELGSFLKMNYKNEIAKNVNLESKLELFTAYDESFGNVDINWQNDLLMKVNDWLSASLITQLIYDDDIDAISEEGVNEGPKVQFKQIFGLGLAATIGDKK